jgi:hypothetical protein
MNVGKGRDEIEPTIGMFDTGIAKVTRILRDPLGQVE